MRIFPRRVGWALIGTVPVAAMALLLTNIISDPTWPGPVFHFYIVSTTAFIATLLAILMAVAAGQVRDARVFFLALSFMGIAGFFFVHALTTPGVLIPDFNPWVGFSSKLSLFSGAFFLLLSAVDARSRLHEVVVRHQSRVLSLFIVLLVLYAAVAVGSSLAGPEPVTTHLFNFLSSTVVTRIVAAATLGMFVYVVGRYIWLYRIYHTPLITGMLISSILLLQAAVSMELAPLWHASWWLYHVLMLAAFVMSVVALAREYRLSGSLQGVVEGLLLRDTISQMQRGYTEVIVALVAAVEARDSHTRGHTERVAALAARLGKQLGLSQERVKTLHQSALLHDIGKIGIPDSILNKPGRLTDEEFDVIRQHPVRGHAIVQSVRSLQAEVGGIRHHHERLDGSGYPDGLRGDEIPLDARIIVVADVFDALTSERPYRRAYTVDVALDIIDAEAGTKLDPVVVAALHAVVPAWSAEELPSPACAPAYAD